MIPQLEIEERTPSIEPLAASRLLADLSLAVARRGETAGPLATGYHPLDTFLNGGFSPGNLVVTGGKPGTGKTVMLMQWAREMAKKGTRVAYVCYDHGERALLGRLLTLELGEVAAEVDGTTLEHLRTKVRDHVAGRCSGEQLVDFHPALRIAYDEISDYGDNLVLYRGSVRSTDLRQLRSIADSSVGSGGALFVDFIQKVPAGASDGHSGSTVVAAGLKDLAVDHDVAVIAAASVNEMGLRQRRLRVDHLNAAAALVHEADLLMLLNDKSTALSKNHLAYDLTMLERARGLMVLTIEKNRDGPAPISFEFHKRFSNFRFDPQGGFLSETLIDDTLFEE